MKSTTIPMSWLTNVHPGNPHGLRFADGDAGEQGDGEGTERPGEESGRKTPPWERKGEEFDAEKAKTLLASLQREADSERAKRVAAEAKVKDHEDAQLSETEKLTRERDEAKTSAAQNAALVDRYEAAEEAGLPLSWARRLVGGDRDALLEDAKRVKADLDEMSKGGPRNDPSQGGGRGQGGSTSSVAAAKEEYLERRSKR